VLGTVGAVGGAVGAVGIVLVFCERTNAPQQIKTIAMLTTAVEIRVRIFFRQMKTFYLS
jgi:hypothetical protein